MRAFRLLTLALAFSAVALASNGTLPKSTAIDVRNAIERADAALLDGERQFALALYEGSLYSDDVKLAIDERTLDSFKQKQGIVSALETWERVLEGDLPIRFVDRIEDADVVVQIVDSIPERGQDALGLIKLEKSYRWSRSSHSVSYKGTISIVRSAPGGRLSQSEVADVAMHEIGHLLGLADAGKIGLLMGPMERGNPLSEPTDEEIEDVKALRRTLRQRIKSAIAANF